MKGGKAVCVQKRNGLPNAQRREIETGIRKIRAPDQDQQVFSIKSQIVKFEASEAIRIPALSQRLSAAMVT